MAQLVERMSDPHRKQNQPQMARKNCWSTRSRQWIGEIDRLVYKLYGLAEDEVRIVKSKSPKMLKW
jgi:hypothetical protein